jgi:hypothetical protein
MDTLDMKDADLAARLRRLDAAGAATAPGFDYQGLLDRHAMRQARARRRRGLATGVAGVLTIAMIAVSAWRLDGTGDAGEEASLARAPTNTRIDEPAQGSHAPSQARAEQRLVRADTYLALAALEDQIATIDDALSDARLVAPGGSQVARLERTRAELLDSYARVRYADMVAANF